MFFAAARVIGGAVQAVGGWSTEDLCQKLRQNATPERVVLEFCVKSADGWRRIFEALGANTSCLYLNLACCGLGDEQIQQLAHALRTGGSAVRGLNLSFNPFSDKGGEQLADVLGNNCTIYFLDLQDTNVGDRTAFRLRDSLLVNSRLATLELSGTRVTDVGAKEIQIALASRRAPLDLKWELRYVVDSFIMGAGRTHASETAAEEARRAGASEPTSLQSSIFFSEYCMVQACGQVQELHENVKLIVKLFGSTGGVGGGCCIHPTQQLSFANQLCENAADTTGVKGTFNSAARQSARFWTNAATVPGLSCGKRYTFYGSMIQGTLRADKRSQLMTEVARFCRTLNTYQRLRRSADTTTNAAGDTAECWHFKDDADSWRPYAPEDDALLESVTKTMPLTTTALSFAGGKPYVIDFDKELQRNLEMGTERKICRMLPVPLWWPDKTFRGAWIPRMWVEWFTTGKQYRYKGYLATSELRSKADFFLRTFPPGQECCDKGAIAVIFEVYFDQHLGCHHVNLFEGVTAVKGEHEWAFQGYSSFTVRAAAPGPLDPANHTNSHPNPVVIKLDAAADNQLVPLDVPVAEWH
eukprot:TRINITY_DN15804_c0_g1_i1.p1 TRINITY_DN15804_c0_g1~~TRINITY_DN15804_c0_g1_i1.p1  ORF type:complete len:596 (-),score=98.68 TRINITY_DN15804_c0_g1_i1:117-1868(-)